MRIRIQRTRCCPFFGPNKGFTICLDGSRGCIRSDACCRDLLSFLLSLCVFRGLGLLRVFLMLRVNRSSGTEKQK